MKHKDCHCCCDCNCGRGNIREKLCSVLRHNEKCNDGWSGWRVERNMNCTNDNHQRYDIYIVTLDRKTIDELESTSGLRLVYVESYDKVGHDSTVHAIFDESWDV